MPGHQLDGAAGQRRRVVGALRRGWLLGLRSCIEWSMTRHFLPPQVEFAGKNERGLNAAGESITVAICSSAMFRLASICRDF
jgi:hypothetical protein